MESKKLKLGLDIGTNSVGWALLDENNNIVKKNSFAFWGVRMFDESKAANERRGYRSSRRRLARRKERVKLVREIFAPEIYKVDPTFYERLDDSFYKIEDKRNQNIHNLFTEGYTDKEFFDEYPTIYHLRDALMKEHKKFDIRMIFLAINQIMTHRGNFLTPGDEFKKSDSTLIENEINKINEILGELDNEYAEDESYDSKYFMPIDSNVDVSKIEEILLNDEGIRAQKEELIKLFGVEKKGIVAEAIVPLIVSKKVSLNSISLVKSQKLEKFEIDLYNEGLEALIDEKRSDYPLLNALLDYIPNIKNITDFYYVVKILGDKKSISEAMIKIYEDHKEQLRKLKDFVKEYAPAKYDLCFRIVDDKTNNYPAYVGFNNTGDVVRFKHCKREDFYTFLKKNVFDIVTSEEAKEEKDEFLKLIDNNELLLKQNSDQNGSFPMQLHLSELKTILNNQAEFYPFLKEESDGLSNIDKIISIFKFRIPYYVGPLNSTSEKAWIKRSNEKIYPWNFDKVVKIDETAEIFITRMQNKCTYLKGDNDYCAPKHSLLFSEYNCLSYLNKLNINGSLISVDVKKAVFENVFLKKKQPTKKDIADFLTANYNYDQNNTVEKKSWPEINCNMSSYIKFKEIFGSEFDNKRDMIENIIRDITIFEDKGILEERLKNVYQLEPEVIKKIKDLNYKDYGRLSLKLLNGITCVDNETGEYVTIIDIMRNTNYNLQEILFDERFKMNDVIDEYNKKENDSENESVEVFIDENIIVPPNAKRALFQSYKLIEEIENIFKRPIDEFYVECTRTNKAEKKPTSSRYNKLVKLYDNCKEIALMYNVDIKDLRSKLDKNKDKLRSDLLYLYFTQLGKCMYTLENIDIDDLINNNKYDIDHIYPQSIIKDDSISNRVLVKKGANNRKTDKFIFEVDNLLNKDCYGFYKKLLDLDLISKEKYRRLTKKELSSDELNNFVNRQLVSTNQTVKALIETLKLHGTTKNKNIELKNIIYSKGENVSDFRKIFDLVKSRTANNFHHAHDAYLNVVVGSILNKYYNSFNFYKFTDVQRLKSLGKSVNPDRLFQNDQIISNNGEILWDKSKQIPKIKHDLYERFDIHETLRTYNSNEMLSKVTIMPAGKGTVPIQTSTPRSQIEKYGGITSNSYCKYVIVKNIDKKDKVSYILEAIPRMAINEIKDTDINEINKYLESIGYVSGKYEIMHDNIKSNVIIEQEKLRYCITGKTGNQYLLENQNERYFSYNDMKIIKKIDKYLDNKKNSILMLENEDEITVSPAKNNKCDAVILTNDEVSELLENIKKLYSKNIFNFSATSVILSTISLYEGELSIYDKITLANQLLQFLKTNERKIIDLSIIGGLKNLGTMRIGKSLKKGMKFISESITGYYKKVLFEVK